jgi:hypothetical protein
MNRMNASDITKAKQSRTLYQAYYRPTFFSTIINSTINLCPVSSNTTSQSFTSTVSYNYLSRCTPPAISYELANSINQGRYLCPPPFNSTISEWNTGQQFNSGSSDCKVSFLTWKNTNPTTILHYESTEITSFTVTSSIILTGPSPIICPLVEMVQGTSFQNRCNTCGVSNGGYCNDCSSGQ